MKILRQGFNSDDGIFFQCEYCRCEWLVQNRNDLNITYDYDLYHAKRIPGYMATCPCCGNKIYIGYDPRDIPELVSPWNFMFQREDWIERFAANDDRNE